MLYSLTHANESMYTLLEGFFSQRQKVLTCWQIFKSLTENISASDPMAKGYIGQIFWLLPCILDFARDSPTRPLKLKAWNIFSSRRIFWQPPDTLLNFGDIKQWQFTVLIYYQNLFITLSFQYKKFIVDPFECLEIVHFFSSTRFLFGFIFISSPQAVRGIHWMNGDCAANFCPFNGQICP